MHTGHLCQWFGLNCDPLPKKRKGKRGVDRARVTLRWSWLHLSFLHSSSFSFGQTSPHCAHLSVWLSSPLRPFLSIQQDPISKWVNKGGRGWDGRREGQTNNLGSTLFVVLFHQAIQETTKQHKGESSVPFPKPLPLPCMTPKHTHTQAHTLTLTHTEEVLS